MCDEREGAQHPEEEEEEEEQPRHQARWSEFDIVYIYIERERERKMFPAADKGEIVRPCACLVLNTPPEQRKIGNGKHPRESPGV